MKSHLNLNLLGLLLAIMVRPILCMPSIRDFLSDYKWQVLIVIGGIILLFIQLIILVCLQRRPQIANMHQHSIDEQDSVRHNDSDNAGAKVETNDDLGVKESPRTDTKKKRRRKRDRMANDANKSRQDIQTPQHQQSFDQSFEMP